MVVENSSECTYIEIGDHERKQISPEHCTRWGKNWGEARNTVGRNFIEDIDTSVRDDGDAFPAFVRIDTNNSKLASTRSQPQNRKRGHMWRAIPLDASVSSLVPRNI